MSKTKPPTNDFDQQLRVMQSIVAALASGALVFAVTVLMLSPADAPGDGPLTKLALLCGLGALFLSNPVARALRSRGSRPGQPLGPYMTSVIAAAAILDGGVFLNLIAHMQERSPWTLAMAALLLAALAYRLPTRNRVQAWLEQEALRLRDGGSSRGNKAT